MLPANFVNVFAEFCDVLHQDNFQHDHEPNEVANAMIRLEKYQIITFNQVAGTITLKCTHEHAIDTILTNATP